ncbi:MAG: hypothetical protein ACF8PN_02720 [Phycisphaerales bacterium]
MTTGSNSASECGDWIRWTPDRFYWAILDRASAPEPLPLRRRRRREQLGYLFEHAIPTPIESIHAEYVELPDDRWLAIGVCRDTLEQSLPDEATRLTPIEAPGHLRSALESVDLEKLNLLTNDAEPPRVGKSRRQWAIVAATLSAAILSVLIFGTDRRRRICESAMNRTNDITEAVYTAVVPDHGDPSLQPASIRMIGELRRLKAAESGATLVRDAALSNDAAQALVEFLRHWPRNTTVRTESLSVSDAGVTVVLLTDSTEDASRFVAGWTDLEGWRRLQPQVREAGREGVRLTLRFESTVAHRDSEGADD